MSFSCPHCGGEIVVLLGPGTPPIPGADWRRLAQTGANGSAQNLAQNDVAHGFEVQDLEVQDLQTHAQNRRPETYPAEFLAFWKIYPRKRDKRKALRAWRNAIRRTSAQVINAGAIRYRDDPNRLDEFTKYAEGWLNGDGWEDEPLPARIDRRRPPDPPRPLTDGEAYAMIEEAFRDD